MESGGEREAGGEETRPRAEAGEVQRGRLGRRGEVEVAGSHSDRLEGTPETRCAALQAADGAAGTLGHHRGRSRRRLDHCTLCSHFNFVNYLYTLLLPFMFFPLCNTYMCYLSLIDLIQKLNAGAVGFYRVRYTQEMCNALMPAISALTLPCLDRLIFVDDLFALVLSSTFLFLSIRLLYTFKITTFI